MRRYYVLEAFDVAGSEVCNAQWKYATTSTFESPEAALLWLAQRAAADARDGNFCAYRLEPVEVKQ